VIATRAVALAEEKAILIGTSPFLNVAGGLRKQRTRRSAPFR